MFSYVYMYDIYIDVHIYIIYILYIHRERERISLWGRSPHSCPCVRHASGKQAGCPMGSGCSERPMKTCKHCTALVSQAPKKGQ